MALLHTAQQISGAERGIGGREGGREAWREQQYSSNYSRETARRRRRWHCLVHTSGALNEGIGKPNVDVDSRQGLAHATSIGGGGEDVTVPQHCFTGLTFLRKNMHSYE